MMLADLQRDFQAWLVTATPGASLGSDARALAGLAVYQNNYRAQLMGCLEQSYPQLRAWIGEEAFRTAAITHIDGHPPHAWTLDAYAEGFDSTLIALFPDNPDVHELAWIEHALGAAFIASDARSVPADALADIDWDTALLSIAPSFRSAVATTNAEQIWSALWAGETPPESAMLERPGGLLVWRRGYTSCLKQVDALEREALLRLHANGSFAGLCDWLVERLGEADGVARAGQLLAGWLASELITGIDAA
ncbi:putative DNA-binding domain-containing protein [Duganella sp. CT11-25]|jgi:hypothetical protein|uniref:HvfC/BufC family peptide modification chaperone n=1 Tax=unclassified Duganella TaxID=2636909 RepID=UPI0039B123EE